MRFQIIAAISAAMTMVVPCSICLSKGFIIPVPIVLATPVNIRAPKKFIEAARTIATLGESARVDTDVAIVLAVSWKPLIKSKMRAKKTIMIFKNLLAREL